MFEMRRVLHFSLLLALLSVVACRSEGEKAPASAGEKPVISNRLQVTPEMVNNLGITFAEVRTGSLAESVEAVGHLEVPAEKRFKVHASAVGRIREITRLWQRVKQGEQIVTLVSPELVETQKSALSAWNVLEDAQRNGGGSKLRTSQLERAFEQQLRALSVITGWTSQELSETKDGNPAWLTLTAIPLRSPGDGVVTELSATIGEAVERGKPLMQILDDSELLFRGGVPEEWLGQLSEGLAARVMTSAKGIHAIETKLNPILPVAESSTGLVFVEAPVPNLEGWLPDGLSATARIQLTNGAGEEAVVPEKSVVQDGLELVLFKRDPAKPDYVIRTPVEIGNRSGDEVEILSGVMEGDQVVLDGVHQLKQTGFGKAPQGGHFHADGTWHEGDQ